MWDYLSPVTADEIGDSRIGFCNSTSPDLWGGDSSVLSTFPHSHNVAAIVPSMNVFLPVFKKKEGNISLYISLLFLSGRKSFQIHFLGNE